MTLHHPDLRRPVAKISDPMLARIFGDPQAIGLPDPVELLRASIREREEQKRKAKWLAIDLAASIAAWFVIGGCVLLIVSGRL